MKNIDTSEVFKGVNLSDAERTLIENKFNVSSVKKGDIILSEGQYVPFQYFVSEGCLRTFFIGKDGKEFTLQFAIKDWWISDYTAFFTGGRSVFYIDCIQNAVIYKISKTSMEELYKEVPQIETFFRIKMERFFGSFQRRILSDLAMSAKEKYVNFLNTYGQIETQIKNYHLASYLGITTESLSRIRKEIAQKE